MAFVDRRVVQFFCLSSDRSLPAKVDCQSIPQGNRAFVKGHLSPDQGLRRICGEHRPSGVHPIAKKTVAYALSEASLFRRAILEVINKPQNLWTREILTIIPDPLKPATREQINGLMALYHGDRNAGALFVIIGQMELQPYAIEVVEKFLNTRNGLLIEYLKALTRPFLEVTVQQSHAGFMLTLFASRVGNEDAAQVLSA